jgi:hypothetical protein
LGVRASDRVIGRSTTSSRRSSSAYLSIAVLWWLESFEDLMQGRQDDRQLARFEAVDHVFAGVAEATGMGFV